MVRRLMLLVLLAGSLVGCAQALQAAWKPQPDIHREIQVADARSRAYSKALQATQAVGGVPQGDREAGIISATIQQAVVLSVTIQADGQGSKITVHTHVPPTHRITGEMTLADDWIRAYHTQS